MVVLVMRIVFGVVQCDVSKRSRVFVCRFTKQERMLSHCMESEDMLLAARATHALQKIMQDAKVPDHHGVEHAIAVMSHTHAALIDDARRGQAALSTTEQRTVLLASLLHDASEPKTVNDPEMQNVKTALAYAVEPLLLRPEQEVALEKRVLELVGWTSTSKNKDAMPSEAMVRPWVLYPRWSDWLEALGKPGMRRCLEITHERKRPLFTERTPRPKTRQELGEALSRFSLAKYGEKEPEDQQDDSMFGHWMRKLLHLSKATDFGGNRYYQQVAAIRHEQMVQVFLRFGQTGQVDEAELMGNEKS